MQNILIQPQVREFLRQKTDQLTARPTTRSQADLVFRPNDREYQLPYLLGSEAGKNAPKAFSPMGEFAGRLGRDVTGTTLAGAGLGGLIGAGAGLARGESMSRSALLGAGGMGLMVYLMNRLAQMRDRQVDATYPTKSAFYSLGNPVNTVDPVNTIVSKLTSDPRINPSARVELIKLLPQLTASQARALVGLVRSASGAGVGYIIAKFLLGLGFTGTTLMSLAGAYAGYLSGGLPNNAYGQKTDTQKDIFGRPRRV